MDVEFILNIFPRYNNIIHRSVQSRYKNILWFCGRHYATMQEMSKQEMHKYNLAESNISSNFRTDNKKKVVAAATTTQATKQTRKKWFI